MLELLEAMERYVYPCRGCSCDALPSIDCPSAQVPRVPAPLNSELTSLEPW